jgi:hypothetical protein
MSLLSLLPAIGVRQRQGRALPDRDMPPQARGNDPVTGTLGKPFFDFRHWCDDTWRNFNCHNSKQSARSSLPVACRATRQT